MTEQLPPTAACSVEVVLATPAHSGLGDSLSYWSSEPLQPGVLVRVPLGAREVLGIVWQVHAPPPDGLSADGLKPVRESFATLPPLQANWRALVAFAARYYQRGLGEVALAALPPQLRELDGAALLRRLKKLDAAALGVGGGTVPGAGAPVAAGTQAPGLGPAAVVPAPSPEQAAVLAALAQSTQPVLLFGATGSGKTEVYLRAAQALLQQDPQAQALVLVPEINLTPQLEARFGERFGTHGVVALHSGLSPAQRLRHWLAAHCGQARIVLGTRMAVFASLPRLRLIVVDEEHDPSYKSQDGARYSARDLAVYRARLESGTARCQVILGSATPALESWHAAEQGRYQRLQMPGRIAGAALPRLRLLDLNQQPRQCLIAPPLLAQLVARAARGEQSLVLLNRRGYAPVLACHACGWKSDCPHCSAHAVFHKLDRSLRCHHCGHASPVPRACPACGNLDIAPVGRGTEQVEEHLGALLAEARRPDGSPVRVARLDADSTRAKGSLHSRLAAMHEGEVDVLVGTQMVAKGHDFRRITLVAGLNVDSGLFASDYRAPERLFALLLQAAGRAGRDAAFVAAQQAEVELWVQTWYPQHPLFAALARHDYPAFAAQQLRERASAQMPPFSFQALLRAEARTQATAQAWLQAAADAARGAGLPGLAQSTLYPPLPLTVQRVAGVERAQMLIESPSRPALQALLAAWQPLLHALRRQPPGRGLLRWAIDVDPVSL
jgi:primosomal protein N' (replication factor Y)